MICIRCLLILIVSAILCIHSGCAQQHDGKAKEAESGATILEAEPALTAEMAKRALLELDVNQIRPGCLVPWPEDAPIEFVEPGKIRIGRYHCYLKERKFVTSAFYPNAKMHTFNQLRGVFEWTADKKWTAKGC